jgi:hypothetical protein
MQTLVFATLDNFSQGEDVNLDHFPITWFSRLQASEKEATRRTGTLTRGMNTREPLTMACHPAIHLVLYLPDAGYLIQNPEQGMANNGVKGGTYGLSSLITAAIGGDRPDDPLSLCHSQSICLRNTRCLKRKTVEAVSPIQNP